MSNLYLIIILLGICFLLLVRVYEVSEERDFLLEMVEEKDIYSHVFEKLDYREALRVADRLSKRKGKKDV